MVRRRALVMTLVVLAACGGGGGPAYDDGAVRAEATTLVATGELLAPNGGPIAEQDLAALFQVVKEGCQSPAKMRALAQSLAANPYLLAMAMRLANAGCPKLVAGMGITVASAASVAGRATMAP
jgi:uncharacterized membrane protein